MRIRKFNEAQFSDDSEENRRTAEERHRNRIETRRVLRHASLDAVNNTQTLNKVRFETSLDISDDLRTRLKDFGDSMQFLIDQDFIRNIVITKHNNLTCRVRFKFDTVHSKELFNEYSEMISEVQYTLSNQPKIEIKIFSSNVFDFIFS